MADSLELSLRQMMKKFGIIFLLQTTCILVIIVVNYITCILLDSLRYSLSFYNVKVFSFGFYVVNSMMAASCIMTLFMERFRGSLLPIQLSVKLILHCHALFVCLFILVGLFTSGNALLYTFCIYVYNTSLTLNLLATGLAQIPRVGKYFNNEHLWIYIHCICQLPNILLYGYVAYSVVIITIPLLGLLGPTQNPDIYMLLLGFLINLLVTCFLIPVYQLFSGAKFIYKLYPFTMVVLFVIAVSNIGFPFNKQHPQKFFIRHTSRDFYTNEMKEYNDSGYFIFPMDRRLYASSNLVENFSMVSNIQTIFFGVVDCLFKFQKEQEFCITPILYPEEFSMGLHFFEGPTPKEVYPKLRIHKLKEFIKNNLTKSYEFNIEGPHVILMIIIPSWNSRLIKWNLDPPISEIPDLASPYIVHLSYADKQLNHTLELEFEKNPVSDESVTIEIILIGHYFEVEKDFNPEFTTFLENFPDYVLIRSWTSKVVTNEYK
ncbi:hypothetical protein ACFFRR_000921 [Megaselia abdita]